MIKVRYDHVTVSDCADYTEELIIKKGHCWVFGEAEKNSFHPG